MAVSINLLPRELSVSSGLSRVLSIVRMIGIISLAAFLIFGLGLGVFFIFSTIELNGLNTTNSDIKSQIKTLSSTESQFYALKDRISKIKIAEGIPTATKNLTSIQPFLSPLTNTTISELDISPSKIAITATIGSNTDLTNFINSISGSNVYQDVTLTTFGFNPSSGYSINVGITSKQ